MNVDGREMNAVLSYLKMTIGRLYYDIDYPIDAEEKIEKSRKKKTGVTRIKAITNIHDNSNSSTKITSVIKSSREENKENINHAMQGGNEPNLSATAFRAKPKQKKKEKLQNKTAAISGSSLGPASRIKQSDESEEMYLSRIRTEWHPIFEDIFGKFVTETNPNDKWTFDLGIVRKEERQNNNNRYLRFLDYNVAVSYRCSVNQL